MLERVFSRPLVWGVALGGLLTLNPAWFGDIGLPDWPGASRTPSVVMARSVAVPAPALPATRPRDPVPEPAPAAPPRDPALADQDILLATDQARRYLPRFLSLALAEDTGWTTVALRVAFPLGRGDETRMLWVTDLQSDENGGFIAVLHESAAGQSALTAGRTVRFDLGQIRDWGFERDQRGYGYFTAHASLPYLAPTEQQAYRAFLAPSPVPPGW